MVNMPNPVLIELTRGTRVESRHRGAFAVARADGTRLVALGDIDAPVYPRSAVKMLQAISFVESGAVDRFEMGLPEVAIACASHSGTPRHVQVVEELLARAGLTPAALGCGAHEPLDAEAARALARAGRTPLALHNNCSGKHAAMLATAAHRGEPIEGYWRVEHPVQQRVREVLQDLTGAPLAASACGIDGCSVPSWAIGLADLARAFARFATQERLAPARAQACRRIAAACFAHPDLVAGERRLDTRMMQELRGQVLLKSGAEGVYCGALLTRGVGFAIKIDDGAKRAAEAVAAGLVASQTPAAMAPTPDPTLKNVRGLRVGTTRASQELQELLHTLDARSAP
jgi:L-asparaginase II